MMSLVWSTDHLIKVDSRFFYLIFFPLMWREKPLAQAQESGDQGLNLQFVT